MNQLTDSSDESDSDDIQLVRRESVGADLKKLQPMIDEFKARYSNYSPLLDLEEQAFKFTVPNTIIPRHMQLAYGFDTDPTLFRVSIQMTSANWRDPAEATVVHPTMNDKYVGRTAQMNRISKFFSSGFQRQSSYSSKLAPVMMNNEVYVLICELLEPIFESMTRCCVCRDPLPYPVIKAAPCSKPMCITSFVGIGVGASIWAEIHRDPLVADFIVSLFSGSLQANMRFMTPPPPPDVCAQDPATIQRILDTIPSMNELDTQCRNDADIMRKTGRDGFELLKWLLLSNENNLVSIPQKLGSKFPTLSQRFRFINLTTNPDRYVTFEALKKKYGSRCFWHGSGGEKWHSIHRNGLKNYSNTEFMSSGAAYGSGIYLAPQSSTSYGYSSSHLVNTYKQSVIKDCRVIALTEVCHVPELLHHGWCSTLANDNAIVVRFLLVDAPGVSPDIAADSVDPSTIPTIEQVMDALK